VFIVYLSTFLLVNFTLCRIVELLFNDELEFGGGRKWSWPNWT